MDPLAQVGRHGGKRKIAKETAWAFASKGAALAGTYGLLFFLVNRLDVAEFGRWSYFFSVLLILTQTSELGLNTAAKRWFAEYRDHPSLGAWIHAAWRLRVRASAGAGLLTLALAVPVARWTGKPWLAGWLLTAAPWVALFGIVEFYKSLFEAVHRLRLTFQVNLVDNALRLLFCLLVYLATGSVPAMVLALGAAALAAAFSGRHLQKRHLPAAVAGPGADALALARYSVPVFFMSVAGFISTEIDTLMIGGLLDDRATGIFGLPKQLVAFLPHVSVAFTMGAVPALARMAAQADPAARTSFRRLLGLLAVLYGGLALTGFALAAWLPREWLPPGYRESVGPFAGLMPYVFFNALSIFTGTLLNYRGMAGRRFLFLVVTIALNVTLNRWWIPRFGVTGAALASSVAMMPYFLLNWIQCERMLRPRSVAGPDEPAG